MICSLTIGAARSGYRNDPNSLMAKPFMLTTPLPNEPKPRPTESTGTRGISRTSLNFILDTALLIGFLVLLFTNVVVRFVFPAGTQAAGWTLWGHNYDDWYAFQFGALCVFAFGMLVHVMLHWSWVCGVVGSRLTRWRGRPVRIDEGSQTIYGVGLLIALLNILGLAIATAALCIHAPLR